MGQLGLRLAALEQRSHEPHRIGLGGRHGLLASVRIHRTQASVVGGNVEAAFRIISPGFYALLKRPFFWEVRDARSSFRYRQLANCRVAFDPFVGK